MALEWEAVTWVTNKLICKGKNILKIISLSKMEYLLHYGLVVQIKEDGALKVLPFTYSTSYKTTSSINLISAHVI